MGKKGKDSFNDVKAIYESLPLEQKLLLSPRGRFIDSPFTALRVLSPDRDGFAEAYYMNGGKDKHKAFVTIGVKPEAQGKGIGKYLLKNLISKAREKDIRNLVYRLDSKNDNSRKLVLNFVKEPHRVFEDSEEYIIPTDITGIDSVSDVMNSFSYWDDDSKWVSRTPQEILSSKVGNCYDTAKLQAYLFNKAHVPHRTFFLVPDKAINENRGDLPTHLFTLHNDGNSWRWLEGSWQPYRNNNITADSAESLADAVKKLMEGHYGMTYLLFPVNLLPLEGLTLGEYYKRLVNGALSSSIETPHRRIDTNRHTNLMMLEKWLASKVMNK